MSKTEQDRKKEVIYKSFAVPVSVKGIIFEEESVWLRKNERDELELPGGKMDQGEQPEETLKRELREELGFEIDVQQLISAHLYHIEGSVDESKGVFVVSYLCDVTGKGGSFELEGEAGPAAFYKVPISDLPNKNIPQFYINAIMKAKRHK